MNARACAFVSVCEGGGKGKRRGRRKMLVVDFESEDGHLASVFLFFVIS